MSLRSLSYGIVAAALVVAGCSPKAPAPVDALVLKNATVIDGTGKAPAPGSSIIVKDGRVAWVGPNDQLQAPAGAETVDLTGKYVMPGLIDLHVHVGNVVDLTQDSNFFTRESVEKDLKTYAAYGVTTVQSMGTEKDSIFPLRDAQRAGRPTMARIYTAGQGLYLKGGYGGVPGTGKPLTTVDEAKAEVNAQADKKVDLIKLWVDDELGTMPKMPPEMSKAIIDEAHRRNLKVYGHIFYLEDAKRLVDQGVDGLVHSVRDQPVDQALIDAMKAHGTVQIAETLSREASLFAFGAPSPLLQDPFFTRSLSPKTLELLASPDRQKTIAGKPHFGDLPKFFEMAMANTKRLADAGVTIGFGTDSGPPGRFAGYFTHWELELLVKAGLSPIKVLTLATGDAAKILSAPDLGTVTTGKWADLVVLDADPTADIMNTRKINSVYIAGAKVAR